MTPDRAPRGRADAEVEIRDETASDHRAVQRVVRAAFDSPLQGKLVAALRADADPQVSLVAVRDGVLAGHIFFSPVTFDADASHPAAQLSPVSVRPDRQGRGLGSALIRAGLERCVAVGWRSVFLVGNPGYYARFGFELAGPLGFSIDGPLDPHLQVIELTPGSLASVRGRIAFHPAFDDG